MNTKKILLLMVAVLVLGVAYYGISPLFRNVEVNDPPPFEESVGSGALGPNVSQEINIEKKFGEEPSKVVDTTAHPASGSIRVIYGEDGRRVLRYEDYKTINGPDIYVYLSADRSANDFVSLDKVKGTEGNINYDIPPEVDLSKYKYVLTWCRAFGVLFNYAELK